MEILDLICLWLGRICLLITSLVGMFVVFAYVLWLPVQWAWNRIKHNEERVALLYLLKKHLKEKRGDDKCCK